MHPALTVPILLSLLFAIKPVIGVFFSGEKYHVEQMQNMSCFISPFIVFLLRICKCNGMAERERGG